MVRFLSFASLDAWSWLLLAGACEVCWAVLLRRSDGFSHFWPALGSVAGMACSVVCLSAALRSLPLGTAYAVWTGTGGAATTIFGLVFLRESRSLPRMLCILAIIGGIVGLRWIGEVQPTAGNHQLAGGGLEHRDEQASGSLGQ